MVGWVDVGLQTVPGFRALRTRGRRQTMDRGGRAHGGAGVPGFEVSGGRGVIEGRMDFLWESCKFFHGGVFKTLEAPSRWKFHGCHVWEFYAVMLESRNEFGGGVSGVFRVQLGRLASVWGAMCLVLPDFAEAHSIPGELTAPRVSRG
jgi:hypothetical protein